MPFSDSLPLRFHKTLSSFFNHLHCKSLLYCYVLHFLLLRMKNDFDLSCFLIVRYAFFCMVFFLIKGLFVLKRDF